MKTRRPAGTPDGSAERATSASAAVTGSNAVAEDANGSKPFDRCAFKDVNIPEGTKVIVRACLKNGAGGTHRFCFSSTGKA